MIFFGEEVNKEFLQIQKGDILIWEGYQFEDGSEKDSRFLVLSNYKDDTILVVRSTASVEFYENPKVSIYREFIDIPSGQEKALPKRTIIDLNSVRILSIGEVNKLFGATVKKKGVASEKLLQDVNSMSQNSRTLRRDWKEWIKSSS
nr:hypothetical protein [Candidatus Undinarchaeales archaeon ERR594346 U_76725]